MNKKQEEIDNLTKSSVLNIIDMIKEYSMKHGGKSKVISFTKEFQLRINEEINAGINDFLNAIESEEETQLALEFATDIFDVMDALTHESGLSTAKLQEVLITGQTNTTKELIQTFIESQHEKNTFIQKLTEKSKIGQLKNQSYLDALKGYRQTSEARKDVMRRVGKQQIMIDNDVIQKFLSDMSVATKAEVLVKLEKYIESGWYEKDEPLKDYLSATSPFKGNVVYAVNSLRSSMIKRFGEARFEKQEEVEQNFSFRNFNIDVRDGRKRSVFGLAGAGEKDFCIKSPDGKKIFIGDVTSEETGEQNKNSWMNGLRAARKYEKENNVTIDYSVSIVSLFYDENEDTAELKGKFLKKLNNYDQEFIDNFHFLQFISVLGRDTKDYENNSIELLNNVNVNFIGASSEIYCNNLLKLKGEEFMNASLDILTNITTKLVQDRVDENGSKVFYSGDSSKSTVESIPLSVLFRAIQGVGSLVVDYPNVEHKYKDLEALVEDLQDCLVHGGELYNMAIQTKMNIGNLDAFKKENERTKKKFEQNFAIRQANKEKELALLLNNKELLENNQSSIIKLLKDMKMFTSFFPNLNDELDKIRKTKSALIDREVTIDLFGALNEFIDNPEKQKRLIRVPASFKKDATSGVSSPRSILYTFSETFNASYGKNAVAFYKYLEPVIKEMKTFVDHTDNYVNSQINVKSIQSARKNIPELKDKSIQEIKEHLSVRVMEVNEFLSGLLVNINAVNEQLSNTINGKNTKKKSP